jgi:uncharacterized protein (DUF58 family)
MRTGSALTRRGWALLGMAAAAGAAGYLVGVVELYPLAAAAVVLVLSARTWVGTRTWDVRAARSIRPSRVPAGNEARVLVSVRNHDSRRSPLLIVRDSFADGRTAAAFAVAPLPSGASRAANYRLPAARRGVLDFRALELELCDPFGLARMVRTVAPPASLTVHPRVELLHRGGIPSDSERDQRVAVPLLGRGGDEFYALREYQVGDDLRQVHWVSTARTDELMIRQPQNLWRGKTTIVLDARSSVHDTQSFEEALTAAASLAVSGLRGGMQVRLVVVGGQETGSGMGAGHEGRVLDTLAMASPTSGGPLGAELRLEGARGPVVLVTTDAASSGDLSAAGRAAGRSDSAIVLIGRRGGRSPGDRGASGEGLAAAAGAAGGGRCRVVQVAAGGSFVEAWIGRNLKSGIGARC